MENQSFDGVQVMQDQNPARERSKPDMITVRLPAELHQRLKTAAARQQRTLNGWCVDALRARLEGSPIS